MESRGMEVGIFTVGSRNTEFPAAEQTQQISYTHMQIW